MQRMTLIALVLGASVAGCKKKEEAAPAPTGGTAPATGAAPSGPRPSDQPLAAMPPPPTLPPDPARPAKIVLGNALFFDKRLSVDGSRACYSCHLNEDGTGGHDPIAIGAGDKPLTRHAPVMWNQAYFDGAFYWDGRSKTLEEQAKGAWGGGNMGVGKDNLEKKAAEIGAIAGYQPLFQAAFGDPSASADRIATALAEYERTLICDNTAYDRFAKGDKAALSPQQRTGLDVFMGKGACAACHTPPHFTLAMQIPGGSYFNAGVGTDKPEAEVDVGRFAVTSAPADWASFKVPSLRNVAKTKPYFHDGSAATLEEAVTYMANGARANKNLSALLAPKNLTPQEISDVVAFLGALDCDGSLVEPKLP